MRWQEISTGPIPVLIGITAGQFRKTGYLDRLKLIEEAQRADSSDFLVRLKGDTLYKIGVAYWKERKTEQAWSYLSPAAEIFRRNNWGDENSLECLRLLTLTNSFLKRKDAARAYGEEFTGLLQRSLDNSDGRERKYLLFKGAQFLLSHSVALSNSGAPREALRLLQKARAHFQELNWEAKVAQTYRQEIICRDKLKEYDKAVEAHRRSRKICGRAGLSLEAAKADWSLSHVYYIQRQYKEALALHHSALPVLEQSGYGTYWNHYQIGLNLLHLSRVKEALAEFEEAIRRFEKRREELQFLAFRRNFQEDILKIYQTAAALLSEQGDINRAFTYAERSRSMTFAELLENSKVFKNPRGDDSRILADLQKVKKKFRRLTNELERKKNSFQIDRAGIDRLESKIAKVRRDYTSRVISIDRERYPITKLSRPVPITPEEITAKLDKGQAVIEYYVTRKHVLAFIITRDGLAGEKLICGADELRDRVELYLNELDGIREACLRGQSEGKDRLSGTYPDAREELYEALMKPIARHLEGKDHVIFIPHGQLFAVPFHLLGSGTDSLIDRYSISYLPGLGVLKYRGRETRDYTGTEADSVLLIDNPLRDRNFTTEEIRSISGLLPEGSGTVWEADDVTPERFFKEAGRYSLIHFAGHSYFNERNPFFSHLKFRGEDESEVPIDVDDIISYLRLPETSLMVLSSCSSGRVEAGKAGEIVGLIRGLIFAGAPSLVLSMWNVEDRASRDLMVEFYRHLTGGDSPARALRSAQLAMREKYLFPHLWGGFVHFGL